MRRDRHNAENQTWTCENTRAHPMAASDTYISADMVLSIATSLQCSNLSSSGAGALARRLEMRLRQVLQVRAPLVGMVGVAALRLSRRGVLLAFERST
jgi:hypothetical protein